MSWNHLQVEVAGRRLHPVLGAGGMTREAAHAYVRGLLERFVEGAPYADGLVEAWDAGARDDTAYAGPYLWAIYEADDAEAGAKECVEDLARSIRRSGTKVTIVW